MVRRAGIVLALASVLLAVALIPPGARGVERVFKINTGGLRGIKTDDRIHIVFRPDFDRSSPIELLGGGRNNISYQDRTGPGNSFPRRIGAGIVKTQEYNQASFEVYTVSEVNTKYAELVNHANEKAEEAKRYAANTIKPEVIATLNKIVKEALPKQVVNDLKASLLAELKEDLRRELKEELRREIREELLQDRPFRASIVKEVLKAQQGGSKEQ
jgi:hypothetical protein